MASVRKIQADKTKMAKVLALTLALSTAVSAMELTPETWDDAVAGKTGAKTRGGGEKPPRARARPWKRNLSQAVR